MPTLSRPHCELYYEVSGEGPTIVFAHGAGGNHLSWWQQVPVFNAAYRCVVFDHRGWGRSIESAGGPGPDAFVDDLLVLLDALEIDRAALIAQSMGGRTCLGVSLRAPERVSALVMADTTGGFLTEAMRPAYEQARTRLRQEGLASLAYHAGLPEREPALAFLYDEIMALNPPRDPGMMNAINRVVPDPEDVAALQMPLLWVVGSDDALVPAAVIRAAHAHVAGSEYFEVPEAGHSVYFERAAEFNARVKQFLSDCDWGGETG